MPRSQGYATWTPADGPLREADTFTCAHCQRIVIVKAGAAASDCGGWCARCARAVCGPCADMGSCDPFEKKLEQVEARYRLFRSMGL